MAEYVTREELYNAWREAMDKGQLTTRLAKHLYNICHGYSFTPRFVKYSPREELISACMEKYCKIWMKPRNTSATEGGSLFSFFTLVAHRTFLHVLMTEQKERDRFIAMGLYPDQAALETPGFLEKYGDISE